MVNEGRLLARQGRVDEAADRFREAVRLRPDKKIWNTLELELCPPVFQDSGEMDRYRAGLQQRLEELAGPGLAANGDDLLREAGTPSFNLAHHGRNNRPIKERFASLYAPQFRQERPRPGRGKPRVGFLVTEGHEAGFLRRVALASDDDWVCHWLRQCMVRS